MSLSQSLRIGVLRGGPSSEYDVSLKTGGHVLRELSETHQPLDIFISKDGTWHVYGLERSPDKVLKQVDVVFNALHGSYGEDGGVQELLDQYNIPYTGSDKLASAVAMNKYLTKVQVEKAGIKTPLYTMIRRSDDVGARTREIFSTLPHPVIVKPVSSGSSVGISIANTPEELLLALKKAFTESKSVLVEEYISGKEATCGVISDFRGESIYAMPPVETRLPQDKDFLDYDAKYSGESREVCPGNFTQTEKSEMERASKLVHDMLGLAQYSRSDFVVHPRRGVYFLEVNTLPSLHPTSAFAESLEAVGVKTKDFLHHVLSLALNKK